MASCRCRQVARRHGADHFVYPSLQGEVCWQDYPCAHPPNRRRNGSDAAGITSPRQMHAPEQYLDADVRIEPIAAKWYAWPHLIAPATHAMNIAFRHLRVLESYLENPAAHIAASRLPELLGGPFMKLTRDDIPAVQALKQWTQRECAQEIQFARDLKALNVALAEGATGFCMDERYDRLPPSLRGLVELTYDLWGRPHARIREQLLYAGADDTRPLQGMAVYSCPDAERGFSLTTPHLDRESKFLVSGRYSSPQWDALTGARSRPTDVGELAEHLGIPGSRATEFARLFVDHAVVRGGQRFAGPGLRIRYFGHACTLVQSKTASVLIDPFYAYKPDSESTLCYADLPDRLDYVVITHAHGDHLVPEYLLPLRSRTDTILVPESNLGELADPSLRLICREMGFARVAAMGPLETAPLPGGGEIVSLPFPGEQAGLDIYGKQAVGICIDKYKIALLADSEAIDRVLYRRLRRYLGNLDMLFIGMECIGAPATWLYGPLMPRGMKRKDDESRRVRGSSCEQAWSVVEELGCREAYVYAMGLEPWTRHLLGIPYTAESVQIRESDRFVGKCREAGIAAHRLNGTREWHLQ